jgi:hypothetical protein
MMPNMKVATRKTANHLKNRSLLDSEKNKKWLSAVCTNRGLPGIAAYALGVYRPLRTFGSGESCKFARPDVERYAPQQP